MKDRLWQAVYDAVQPLLNDRDVVAAPRGDWPPLQGTTIFYDDLIELEGCTVLVLHKGLLTSLRKAELRVVAAEWQRIFANEVFLVFSRARRHRRDYRYGANTVHWRPLTRYLSSASLRRRHSKIVYVHVPKTGGTAMWASLTGAFPSHVYYASLRAYLRNPPAPDDYDLIGLHFSPSVVLPSLRPDDWVIGMVREPAQRLLSAVMHSRRETEDITTFTPSAKAMRQTELAQYLATGLGQFEARLQLILFGADYRQAADTLSDCEMLYSARAFAQRDNVILAPSELSLAFIELVSHRLGFRPRALLRLNANATGISAAYPEEVKKATGLIDAINAREREFYAFVCQYFDEHHAAQSAPHGRSIWPAPRRRGGSARRVQPASISIQAARAGQTGSLWPSGTEGRAHWGGVSDSCTVGPR